MSEFAERVVTRVAQDASTIHAGLATHDWTVDAAHLVEVGGVLVVGLLLLFYVIEPFMFWCYGMSLVYKDRQKK